MSAPPALPVLPDEHRQPFTETTSSPATNANGDFFKCLPPEIRRCILVEAFGERTVHLDLRLEHPLRNNAKLINSRSKCHANAQVFHPSLRDFTRPREWTWWSSVCHQHHPSSNPYQRPPGLGMLFRDPAHDCCRNPLGPRSEYCEFYPGQFPDKCFIGVIGWLLACRQAYVEGIDVLYATNRFHIAYAELATCLPRLLPSQHVSAISEVQLSWNVTSSSSSYFHWDADDKDKPPDRLAMLSHLPQVFPNLRYLYISLEKVVRVSAAQYLIGGHELYEATEEVLRVIDAVVMRMSRLQECRIALPSSLYATHKRVEKGEDVAWRMGSLPEPDTLWRNVPTTGTFSEVTIERQSISGYWIVHGYRDWDPFPEVCGNW